MNTSPIRAASAHRTNTPAPLELQSILDRHFGDVPTMTPVGCNLVIMQEGKDPLYLRTENIHDNAPQHWGTLSKQFTAACIAKLVTSGALCWNDDIRDILDLPPFTFHGEEENITIDNLLHMRSGLPEITSLATLAGTSDLLLSMEEKLALLSKHPKLHFKPGSQEQYCSTNYYLLALIADYAAKKEGLIGKKESFVDLVRQEVFSDPQLQMECRYSADTTAPRSIDGYDHNYNLISLENRGWGATGIIGTLSDMVKWNSALNDKHWRVLLTLPTASSTDGKSTYCRGLFVTEIGDYTVIHHSGSIDGFTSEFMRYEHRDKAKSFSFFLTTNADNISRTTAIADEIVDHLAGSNARIERSLPSTPLQAVRVNMAQVAPFEGNFHCSTFGTDWKVEAIEEKNTWSLNLSNKDTVINFVPIHKKKGTAFKSPLGDELQLTHDGLLLKGAHAAPVLFVREPI